MKINNFKLLLLAAIIFQAATFQVFSQATPPSGFKAPKAKRAKTVAAAPTTTPTATTNSALDSPGKKDVLVYTESTNPDMLNNFITFNVGSVLLNPYKLGTSNVLERSDSKAAFYIEFAVNNVWAWNPQRRTPAYEDTNWLSLSEIVNHRLDLQARLSYYLRSGKPTNEVASALVGSGDFAGELSLGWNLFQKVTTDDSTEEDFYDKTLYAQSFGLVGSYGATTDSSAFDIHSRYLIGFGYRLAHKTGVSIPNSTHYREALFSTQIGRAWIDNVEYVNNSSRTIKMINGDLPEYSRKECWAIETELYYPLGSYSSLVLGARLYPGQGSKSPNQWSAYIGVTYSIEKLKTLIPGAD